MLLSCTNSCYVNSMKSRGHDNYTFASVTNRQVLHANNIDVPLILYAWLPRRCQACDCTMAHCVMRERKHCVRRYECCSCFVLHVIELWRLPSWHWWCGHGSMSMLTWWRLWYGYCGTGDMGIVVQATWTLGHWRHWHFGTGDVNMSTLMKFDWDIGIKYFVNVWMRK